MMRYLLLLSTLTLSLMFSSASSAEWTFLGTIEGGAMTHYLDLDRIRKNDGYVWRLRDYLKPDKWGDMSSKVYLEYDCKAFRYKGLTYIFYKQPMGEGKGESTSPSNPEWEYPPPDSMAEFMLNKVCAQ